MIIMSTPSENSEMLKVYKQKKQNISKIGESDWKFLKICWEKYLEILSNFAFKHITKAVKLKPLLSKSRKQLKTPPKFSG